MAVTEALKSVPGTRRLIAARWLISILAALPGVLVAGKALGELMARRPFFSDAADPLPLVQFSTLLGRMPGSVWAALGLGLVLAWLANLLLTAGAVEILDPARSEGKVRVWRSTVDTGTRFLWQYPRVSLLALVLVVLGAALLGKGFTRIAEHGEVARWSGYTLSVVLPLIRGFVVLAWASLVGVLAWWLRVLLVADGRRLLRRLLPVVPRIWWRHSVQALLLHWLLAMGSVLLAAQVLIAWRQSAGAGWAWFALWLAVLLLQAGIWHWRLRICRLLWAQTDADDLRTRADEPWHLWRRLYRRLRNRLKPVEV